MVKILYVEDNEDNVYMLSRRLPRYGFDVILAADGEEGIARAKAERPDLILWACPSWTAGKRRAG
jgi:two-component system, cell cycle response regulator DivK